MATISVPGESLGRYRQCKSANTSNSWVSDIVILAWLRKQVSESFILHPYFIVPYSSNGKRNQQDGLTRHLLPSIIHIIAAVSINQLEAIFDELLLPSSILPALYQTNYIMKLHRSKGHVEPPSRPLSHPCISGRSLIACQNCASAKTGCDKKLPCSRCLEKNLHCITRYARRASKVAQRAAAQAASSLSTNSLLTSTVENSSETILLQSPIQHLHGGPDQYDDHFQNAFINPLSPLSGYSAAATSLGSSSYSDVNAFEHGQNSPIHVGFSEFSTKMELIDSDVSMGLPSGFRCCPENTDSCSNKLTPFSEIHSFKDPKNYGGITDIPQHFGKNIASFQGSFCNPLLDISSTLNPPYLSEVPGLHLARIWIRRLKRKRLFDNHTPNFHADESIQFRQRLDLDSQHPSHDRHVSFAHSFVTFF